MTAEIVNLRRARKAKARASDEAAAAENRIRFGRTKDERRAIAALATLDERRLEGHRLEGNGPEGLGPEGLDVVTVSSDDAASAGKPSEDCKLGKVGKPGEAET